MAAINFNTFPTTSAASPYSTTLTGTEGFTCTRSDNLFINSLTSGLSGPCSHTGTGLIIWYPQSAGQGFFSTSGGGTTYTVGSSSLSLFKGRTSGGTQIASFTLNANFAGAGGVFVQNDESAAMSTVTINGTVSGMTGVSPDSIGTALKIYVGGTLNIRDMPAQLTYESAAGNSCTTNVTNNTAAATYPTVIVTALQGGASANMALRSNGTFAIKFGNATHGSFRRTTGNAGGVETFILSGTSAASVENEMLYGTTVTVGSVAFKKQDANTWILSGNNSAFSSTALEGGTLRGTNSNAFGGNVTMSTANVALELANNITIANTTAVNAIGTIRNVSGSNTMSGDLTLAGALTLESQAGSLTLSGLIAGSTAVTKNGTGLATLSNNSNSFTSNPSISAGTLAVTSIAASGTASALGAGTGLTLSGDGVLRYTGSTGATLSRDLTAGSITGGFENNGSGSLAVTAGSITGTSTVKLGGTGAGQYNTLGVTVAGGGFTKEGPGRWISTASNNLSGTTTVSAGTLMAANADGATKKLLGGNVTVAAGAKIQTGSDNDQKGRNNYTSLTFAGTSGNPAKLRIGGSAVTPTVQMSGNLTISGAVTWDLTADTFKTPGTYTLIEFVSGSLVGGQPSLATVAMTTPTGRTASNLTYNTPVGGPNTITVQIS